MCNFVRPKIRRRPVWCVNWAGAPPQGRARLSNRHRERARNLAGIAAQRQAENAMNRIDTRLPGIGMGGQGHGAQPGEQADGGPKRA